MNKKIGMSIWFIFALCFLSVTSLFAQQNNDSAKSLEALYAEFRTEAKKPCGQRAKAVELGKIILERYNNDEFNRDIIDFVKKRIELIEKEDTVCRRIPFNSKNWQDVFTLGKKLIAEEGNTPIALDIMLDIVSVGFDRASIEKNDVFINDTLLYAKLAIERIEAGQTSNSGKFGAFVPFKKKDEALAWMNYIAGWILFYKMNQQKEALPYLYKATQIGTEKKNDTTIYTNIGKFYFDEAVRIETEYREKRKVANYRETDETKALLTSARGAAERAMFYFARAYKIAAGNPKFTTLRAAVRKTLIDLFRFRLNLNPDYEPDGIEIFIEDLIEKPLPDLTTPPVKPVLEEPLEIRLKRNKLQ